MGCPLPNGFDFLLLALATWRISAFLVGEEGPWRVARWLRERAGIVHDPEGDPVGYPDNPIAQALGCVWCMSFWMALPMLLLWLSGPGVVLVLMLALSGGAVLMDVAVRRMQV